VRICKREAVNQVDHRAGHAVLLLKATTSWVQDCCHHAPVPAAAHTYVRACICAHFT
jgi:hypothetical protein